MLLLTSTTLRYLSIRTAPQSSEIVVGLFVVGLDCRASNRSQVSCVGNFDSSRWVHVSRGSTRTCVRWLCSLLRLQRPQRNSYGKHLHEEMFYKSLRCHSQPYLCIYFVVKLPSSCRPVVLSGEGWTTDIFSSHFFHFAFNGLIIPLKSSHPLHFSTVT